MNTSKKKRTTVFLLLVSLTLFCSPMAIQAQEADPPVPPQDMLLAQEMLIPGVIEGTGTYFEVTDSEYLNVTLGSSQEISLRLESVPEMVTMHIESASGAGQTQITLSGFKPETTYYKYEDDYHNEVVFTTDGDGMYGYTQDLSNAHLVFIQPRASTIFLNASTGWSKPVGTWDLATKTGTLTQDVTETIQIDSDGITLDGDGHGISGTGTGSGVYLYGRTGVTIKNLNVSQFFLGICVYSSSSNTLTGNTASNNNYGIYLYSSSSNTLSGNTANSNNNYGIYLYSSSSNTLSGNTANSRYGDGIYLDFSSSNTLSGNTANSSYGAGIYLYCSSNNTLTGNTASNNEGGIFLIGSNNNNLTGNTTSNNKHYGINVLLPSYNNTLTGNTASNNGYWGICVNRTNNNTLIGNTASNNGYGIALIGSSNKNTLTGNTVSNNEYYGIDLRSSSNNQIYNNNFINNPTQAYVSGGSGNVFNMPKPIGGNYWSNWTSPDNNADGFVDSPYAFTGGQDNLPWTRQDGWLDNTPPTTSISLSGTVGNNGWYISDVQVTLTATDNEGGSGVDKTQYSFDGTTWDAYTGPFTISTEGSTTVYYRSTDNRGNVESAKTETINIDKTPPEVTISTPAAGAEYLLNQVVIASWTATDALSGMASATGTVPSGSPIDTGTVGTKTFFVTATDIAGNTRTVVVTYYVRYIYSGILPPINADGSSIFKLGSTVPVKFQLRDANGNFVTNGVAKIFMTKISNGIVGTEMEAVSTAAATTGNLFRYDLANNQYIFNLATNPLSAGTWQIRIELDDGTSRYVFISLR